MNISRLQIDGFKRILSLDCEWRRLTVIIGPNGVGKTSILQTFSLLGASARGELADWVSEHGGLANLLTRDKASELRLGLEVSFGSSEPLAYEIALKPFGVSYQIIRESLSQQRDSAKPQPLKHIQSVNGDIHYFDPELGKSIRPNWHSEPLETALSQVPKMFQELESFRRLFATNEHFTPIPLDDSSPARLPQTMRPAAYPNRRGDNLVSYLHSLKEAEPSRYELLIDTIKTAFPKFERLNFPIAAAGQLALTWKERDFQSPFYANELSEGTLRFLWLAALLLSHTPPCVVVIDEPELSLHPELLSLLADLLRDAAQRAHVVVATHSDRLVRFLQPKEILVCDLGEAGDAQFTWADQLDLHKWLEEYSLDQLWSMNLLGGRP